MTPCRENSPRGLLKRRWRWADFGGPAVLVTESDGGLVILKGQTTSRGESALMVRDDSGRLVPITPDHPIARVLEKVPDLYGLARFVAEFAPEEDEIRDEARKIVAHIDHIDGISDEREVA